MKAHTIFRFILLLILPSVLAFVALSAFNESRPLDAAIVNEDSIVTLSDGTQLPGGRQIIAELTKDEDSPITWHVLSKKSAEKGFSDGTYEAVVTIPSDFSAMLARVLTEAAGSAPQITIDVSSSRSSTRTLVSDQLTQAAAHRFGASLTLAYISGTYSASETLAGGIGNAALGARELSTGMNKLSNGAQELQSGISHLDSGAHSLSSGNSALARGAARLAAGAHQLTDGTQQTHTGIGELATGAADLSAGVKAYTDGVQQAYTALAGSDSSTNHNAHTPNEARGISQGMQSLTEGLSTLSQGLQSADTSALSELSDQLSDQLSQGAHAARTLGISADELSGLITACQQGVPGACAGALHYAAGISQGANELGTRLEAGAQSAHNAASTFSGQFTQLSHGLMQASSAASQLNDGIHQLTDGMKELSGPHARELTEGAHALSAGTTRIYEAFGQILDGSRELASGSNELTSGTDSAAQGARQLADGTKQLTRGASQLGEGIRSAQEGSDSLASGLKEADSRIPRYSSEQARNSARTLSNPIDVATHSSSPHHSSDLSALLIASVIWIASLISTLAMSSLARRKMRSSSTPGSLALRALTPALGASICAGALLLVVIHVAGMHFDHLGVAIALILATCAACTIFHEAIVATLGTWGGVGTSLVLLFIQLMCMPGILTQSPHSGFFALGASLLPLPPVVHTLDAATSFTHVTGLGHAFGTLAVWSLVAFIVTIGAIARSRRVSLAYLQSEGRL